MNVICRISAPFPWCGLLMNPQTLDIQTDYNRYGGLSTADFYTIDLGQQPGSTMRTKLRTSLRPGYQILLLDPTLQSASTLIQNAFRIFLLASFKFHYNARGLPGNKNTSENPGFFLDMILDLPRYLDFQIQNKLKPADVKMEDDKRHRDSAVQILDHSVLRYVCLCAFQLKLGLHQGKYHRLLKEICGILRKSKQEVQDLEVARELVKLSQQTELPKEFQQILN